MEFGTPLTKKERRLLRREQKQQAREQSQKKATVWRWVRLLLGTAVVIAVLVPVVRKFSEPLPGQFMPSLGNEHIPTADSPHIAYNSVPPTSGPHVGYITEWGVHAEPIPDEIQVHNLEDGGVMVQYWCGDGTELPPDSVTEEAASFKEVIADFKKGCPELVEQLEVIVVQYGEQVALAPYPNLPSQIALTAWTRIDLFDEFDAERINGFIKAYRGIDHHVK